MMRDASSSYVVLRRGRGREGRGGEGREGGEDRGERGGVEGGEERRDGRSYALKACSVVCSYWQNTAVLGYGMC